MDLCDPLCLLFEVAVALLRFRLFALGFCSWAVRVGPFAFRCSLLRLTDRIETPPWQFASRAATGEFLLVTVVRPVRRRAMRGLSDSLPQVGRVPLGMLGQALPARATVMASYLTTWQPRVELRAATFRRRPGRRHPSRVLIPSRDARPVCRRGRGRHIGRFPDMPPAGLSSP